MTHATDAPGIPEQELGKHHLGSGPVIERGTTMHPVVSELLIEAAEAEDIPYTLSASSRGTGTDADAIHISRGGVATGLVSIPLRYMHSPVEMVQLDDVENTAKLIAAFARRLPVDVVARALTRRRRLVLLLFDIDGTLLIRGAREHAMALHDAIEEVWSVDLREVRVETGGRTDPEIARDILRARRRRRCSAIDDAARAVPARRSSARYAELVPDDLSDAPGARARSTRSRRCDADPAMRLSLVTGNVEGVARLKLRARRDRRRSSSRARAASAPTRADRADLPPVARARAGRAVERRRAVAARAHRRDRRHAARHRLRARRRRARRRGPDRAVRRARTSRAPTR